MRFLLSGYDSRGGVEPLAGLAVRLRALGADVRVCAPPDFAERLAGVDGPTPTFESPSAALGTALTPETRARATAVAGTIRTDGTTVAAKLLLDTVSREKPPVSV
ncbi:hypothetical protein ALI22I_29870 [Saccharothrix sp. ALI-22-I]|uniref:hypothetical protein n=1 Tax=Saccharothrix sp. ALI-22-I TaxID=1933778 RepID=UPI0009D310D4|nr:hypothetical protein ALI22I_29870 [Saccharothrix sp. ALI-22-I]